MTAAFLAIILTLPQVGECEAEYVLDHPGIALGYLAPELDPPLEGTLTEESGSIISNPNPDGVEYRIYYWREDADPDMRRGDWLVERLTSTLPPDQAGQLVFGDMGWTEGSMLSPWRESASMGLMPVISFNLVGESGGIVGLGRATAAFWNGYSVLLYGLAPFGTMSGVREELDTMVGHMHLVETGG